MDAGGILRCTPEKVLDFNIYTGHQSHVALSLENPTENFVAFKIKTTAPRSYLVKPSSGVVRPKSVVQVNILLIPLHEQPKENVADRFLVQSTIVDSERQLSKEEWNELSLSKERLSERRLAVNFNWKGAGPAGANPMDGDVSEGLHTLIGRPLPQDSAEFKQRYETVVAFCVALEKQKKELEIELDEIRRKHQSAGGARLTGVKGNAGLEYWQVGMLVIAVVFALKIVKFL